MASDDNKNPHFISPNQMVNNDPHVAIPVLKLQLYNHIRSMYDEEIVNQQFLHLQSLGQPLRADAVLRLVTTYCLSTKTLFSSLTHQLHDQEKIDYEKLKDIALDFYAKTSSIGAEGVRSACADLIEASEKKDKDGCALALCWAKKRFSYLRDKFEIFVQMERNIISLEDTK